MKIISKSPLSGSDLHDHIICRDHLVSGEEFSVKIDPRTELLVTSPQPDPEIIYKYYESEEYNSHSDNARNLFDKIYELVKNINIRSKYSLLSGYSQKGKVLDIGCGAGDFLKYCQKKGWDVYGMEPTAKARLISEKKLGIKINHEKSLSSYPDNYFDSVTMWHVLEHRYDILETVKELKRITKNNGLIIIALPNYKSYDAAYYKQFWAAYDVPRHLFHFSRKTVEFFLEKSGLQFLKTSPMYFDSFYVSMLSEKNMNGKINILRAFFVGLYSNIKSIFTKDASSLIYLAKK